MPDIETVAEGLNEQQRAEIDERNDKLIELHQQRLTIKNELEGAKLSVAEEKKKLEKVDSQVQDTIKEIKDIKDGNFQPSLYGSAKGSKRPETLDADREDACLRHFGHAKSNNKPVTPSTLSHALFGDRKKPNKTTALEYLHYFFSNGALTQADIGDENELKWSFWPA